MAQHDRVLNPGTLWSTLLARTARARDRGAIQSIPTASEIIEQGGVAFQVRIIASLVKKAEVKAAQPDADPFLSYDPDLFVDEISPTHTALLNKFNVVDHHLLIVTRAFEDQESLLTLQDCEALLICLAGIDGLGFYNAGPVAGASQRHKHLQLIPFIHSTGPRLPIEPLLRSVRMAGTTGTVSGLPFLHAYAPMDPLWAEQPPAGAAPFLARYQELLQASGLPVEATTGGDKRSGPYNLLVTRQWLLLVPRSEEFFEGISINALGFAGAFLVKDATQLAILRKYGPMTALQRVAFPQRA
jgi:sulfate adenylyltransferase (ADP) / ATP adenylyltransferase